MNRKTPTGIFIIGLRCWRVTGQGSLAVLAHAPSESRTCGTTLSRLSPKRGSTSGGKLSVLTARYRCGGRSLLTPKIPACSKLLGYRQDNTAASAQLRGPRPAAHQIQKVSLLRLRI